MDTLIIVAPLSIEPSETLMFRYLTLSCKSQCDLDILLEVEKELKDNYYHWLFAKGALDYINEFITPEERIEGIRLDTELNFPYTVCVKKITVSNVNNLINQIKILKNINT